MDQGEEFSGRGDMPVLFRFTQGNGESGWLQSFPWGSLRQENGGLGASGGPWDGWPLPQLPPEHGCPRVGRESSWQAPSRPSQVSLFRVSDPFSRTKGGLHQSPGRGGLPLLACGHLVLSGCPAGSPQAVQEKLLCFNCWGPSRPCLLCPSSRRRLLQWGEMEEPEAFCHPDLAGLRDGEAQHRGANPGGGPVPGEGVRQADRCSGLRGGGMLRWQSCTFAPSKRDFTPATS